MATEVGTAYVTLLPSAKGFAAKMQSEIGGDVSKIGSSTGAQYGSDFSKSASRGIGSRAGSLFKGIAKGAMIAGGVAGIALGKVLLDSVNVASDLGETLSKSTEVFGQKSMPELQRFARSAADALGQSQRQALDAASTFAVFGKSAGLSGDKLVGFSTDFTSLASDLASFNNTTPQEAIDAIGAALRGEAEPMRRYGVLLDDASMRNEALRLGLVKTTKEALTPQQKVLAAQALIYKQTADAQGDFGRTQGGLANQQRIMAAQADNLKAKIGKGLLPVFVAGATVITTKVMPTLSKLVKQHLPAITDAVTGLIKHADFGAIFERAGDALKGFKGSDASSSLSSITDSFVKLEPVAREFAEQLPGIADLLSVTSIAFGFLADHTDTLSKAMPFLVGGFIALKVAQAAANAVVVLSVPMKVAEVVVNRQLVASNKALVASRAASIASVTGETVAEGVNTVATGANTVAQNANNTAQKAGILTTLRSTATAIAASVAQKAVAVATTAWAAAQRLVNLAMRANPLGLVVLALTALGAALVLAYKKSETFRTIVNTAFAAVKSAASTVFSWLSTAVRKVIDFIQDHWKTLLAILGGPIGLAVVLIKEHWGKIKQGAETAWNLIKGVISGFIDGIVNVVRGILAVGSHISEAWNSARNLTSSLWNGITSAVSNGIGRVLDVVRGIKGKITGALSGAGSWLTGIGRNIVQGLVDGVNGVIDWVRNAIDNLAGMVPDWVKKKLGIASPSKVMKVLGGWIGKGLAEGITDSSEDVGAGLESLRKQIDARLDAMFDGKKLKAKTKAVTSAISKQFEALRAHGRAQDLLTTKLDEAKAKLTEAIETSTAYAKSIRDTVLSFGTVVGLGTREVTDAEGATSAVAATAQTIIEDLRLKAIAAQDFTAVMSSLTGMGLNQTTLDQLYQAGPEAALATAQALQAGGVAAVSEVNALTSQIDAAGTALGTSAAATMHGAAVQAAQQLVEGFIVDQATLDEKAADIVRKMVEAVEKATEDAGIDLDVSIDKHKPKKKKKGPKKLASGGRATGATLAIIGEGREPETVLPDSMLRGLLERTAAQAGGPSEVRVFIGDRELTDIVRFEVDGAQVQQVRQLAYGRRA